MHRSEVAFYRMIERNRDSEKLQSLIIPRCFYARNFGKDRHGVLVLEDLCEQTLIKPIYSGLSVNEIKQVGTHFVQANYMYSILGYVGYVSQILEQLACLHAFSLENPECLNNSAFKSTIARLNRLSKKQYETIRRNMAQKLKKEYPEQFGALIDHFLDTFSVRNYNFNNYILCTLCMYQKSIFCQ